MYKFEHRKVYAFGQSLYDTEHSMRETVNLKNTQRILIVDDDEDILTAGKLLLKRHFGEVVTCNRPEHIPLVMAEGVFAAVLLDMNFSPGDSSGEQGFVWLKRILEIDSDAVVVMITAHGGVDVAVEAMKYGATDFITKPWHNEKLVATLSAATRLRATRSEASQLKLSNKALATAAAGATQPMLGQSEAMQAAISMLHRAAPTDANVLILGENGTGKELAARELHQHSLRASKVFMSVDLGAVAESLFESELFGHKKGAFTGALEERVGRLQAADGGTLLLDEIGNIPLPLQAKLLTVLEQRQVTPLGANTSVAIDVRVIAATNVPRQKLNDEKIFRQDLLFRLNTVEVTLPPLRERVEDIEPIAAFYAGLYARKYRKPEKPLSPPAIAAARVYAWPGNVRALRHAIERAVILAEGDYLEAKDLQLTAFAAAPGKSKSNAETSGNIIDNAVPDDMNLERMEQRLITRALQQHRYNISHTAKALGLTRAALYRRMEKYGL